MAKDRTRVKGTVSIIKRDARTGKVIYEDHTNNLVLATGREWVAARMLAGGTSELMKWIELGMGSASPTATNTGLQTTFAPTSRKVYTTNSRSGTTWTLIVDWATSDANTAGIKEAVIYSTSSYTSDQRALARITFANITKTVNDTLQIQWDISVQSA